MAWGYIYIVFFVHTICYPLSRKESHSFLEHIFFGVADMGTTPKLGEGVETL
jgi:hypothetical protein